MTEDELRLQLEENRKVSDDEEIVLFLEAVAELEMLADYRTIPILFVGFDDEAEDPEMMYEIIHTAEAYIRVIGEEIYLKMVLESLVPTCEHGREWIKLVIKRILNSRACFFAIQNILKICNKETRALLKELLIEIKDSDATLFGNAVDELQQVLDEIEEFLNGSDED